MKFFCCLFSLLFGLFCTENTAMAEGNLTCDKSFNVGYGESVATLHVKPIKYLSVDGTMKDFTGRAGRVERRCKKNPTSPGWTCNLTFADGIIYGCSSNNPASCNLLASAMDKYMKAGTTVFFRYELNMDYYFYATLEDNFWGDVRFQDCGEWDRK